MCTSGSTGKVIEDKDEMIKNNLKLYIRKIALGINQVLIYLRGGNLYIYIITFICYKAMKSVNTYCK